MNTVSSAISRKPQQLVTVDSNTTVLDALKVMAEKNIGSVVVFENNQFAGIMTERDYSRKLILNGKDSTTTLVVEIMSKDLPAVKPTDSIEFCMQQMTSGNIRYMPVFENNQLMGIISMSDVVKEMIRSQQETIDQLQHYITS